MSITNAKRKRGLEYVKNRIIIRVIILTVIRVQEKVKKTTDSITIKGQLLTELSMTNNAKKAKRTARNSAPNKVMQKYKKI